MTHAPHIGLVLLLAMLGAVGDARACPALTPAARDLALERYYADDTGSVVDEKRKRTHETASAPVRGFLSTVVREADRSLRTTRPGAERLLHAECAVAHLEAWASGGALLGSIAGKQSQAERRWTLAGAALAYLKVKWHATPEQHAVIAEWLISVADAAHAAFEADTSKRNNHWYWLGLGSGAVAIATDSPTHWEMARSVMQDAARDIRPDGALPLELARGRRALHYHAFALMPLVTLAELARTRGEDWDAFGDRALARLVTLTARGLADQTIFDALAGVAQERPVKPGAGWLPLYALRHPGWTPPSLKMAAGHRWLGGDVGTLAAILRGAAAPQLATMPR